MRASHLITNRHPRKGPCRNFEILTGACEKNGKIKLFATVFKGSRSLRERSSRFVRRVGHDEEKPTALMTDGAESLLRLKQLLPVPTRLVLDYFHGSGASGDFGLKQTRWRAEGRQAAKHKCRISGRFPSLTRVTGGSPAAEHGLLSADAPEPSSGSVRVRCNEFKGIATCVY
jgi:hypothetical protein